MVPGDTESGYLTPTHPGSLVSSACTTQAVNGRSPAESDIQRYFSVSPPTVHQIVVNLESLGLITRRPGVARSIEVLASPDDIPELI